MMHMFNELLAMEGWLLVGRGCMSISLIGMPESQLRAPEQMDQASKELVMECKKFGTREIRMGICQKEVPTFAQESAEEERSPNSLLALDCTLCCFRFKYWRIGLIKREPMARRCKHHILKVIREMNLIHQGLKGMVQVSPESNRQWMLAPNQMVKSFVGLWITMGTNRIQEGGAA